MSKNKELSNQEMIVKRYLEEQIKNDIALKTLYVPSKIKDCFKFITSCAKKIAVNNCAMVEDTQVFKWARDYYLEELPKNANKIEVNLDEIKEKINTSISDDTKKVLEKADKVLSETTDNDGNLMFRF